MNTAYIVLFIIALAAGAYFAIKGYMDGQRAAAAQVVIKERENLANQVELAMARAALDSIARKDSLDAIEHARQERVINGLLARANVQKAIVDSLLAHVTPETTPDSVVYWARLYSARTQEALELRVTVDSLRHEVGSYKAQMQTQAKAFAEFQATSDKVIQGQNRIIIDLVQATNAKPGFFDGKLGFIAGALFTGIIVVAQ